MTSDIDGTFSVAEKLVLAADELNRRKGGFTAEDLVVQAWRLFPRTFGISGYTDDEGQPEFPDSNRVFAEIMGSKPVRKRGLIRKVGQKRYRLTPSGQEFAELLRNRGSESGGEEGARKASLSREVEGELERLLESRVFEKWRKGKRDAITFHDACLFWRISSRSTAVDLEGRLSDSERIIRKGIQASKREDVSFQHGGDAYSHEVFVELLRVHEYLMSAHEEELRVIRDRTDER